MARKKINLKTFLRFWLPAILWAAVIFSFSAKPTGTASNVDWQDFGVKKTAHMVEYGIFFTLLFRAFLNSGFKKLKALKYSLIIAVLYGFSDEYHQSFTPGREPHIRDVIFDTIGASLAYYYLWKLLPKAPKILNRLAKDFQLILPEEKSSSSKET